MQHWSNVDVHIREQTLSTAGVTQSQPKNGRHAVCRRGWFGGTPQEIRGDALVAEFTRASDAVTAAPAFQAADEEHINTVENDIRPRIRIGISLGEAVVADGTFKNRTSRSQPCSDQSPSAT